MPNSAVIGREDARDAPVGVTPDTCPNAPANLLILPLYVPMTTLGLIDT